NPAYPTCGAPCARKPARTGGSRFLPLRTGRSSHAGSWRPFARAKRTVCGRPLAWSSVRPGERSPRRGDIAGRDGGAGLLHDDEITVATEGRMRPPDALRVAPGAGRRAALVVRVDHDDPEPVLLRVARRERQAAAVARQRGVQRLPAAQPI